MWTVLCKIITGREARGSVEYMHTPVYGFGAGGIAVSLSGVQFVIIIREVKNKSKKQSYLEQGTVHFRIGKFFEI